MEGLERIRVPLHKLANPLYLALRIRNRHASRLTERGEYLGEGNAEAMKYAGRKQTSAADSRSAMHSNGLISA